MARRTHVGSSWLFGILGVVVVIGGMTAWLASGASTSAARSTRSRSEASGTKVPNLVYNGPEAKLPQSYPMPKIRHGLKCTLGYLDPDTAIEDLGVEAVGFRGLRG